MNMCVQDVPDRWVSSVLCCCCRWLRLWAVQQGEEDGFQRWKLPRVADISGPWPEHCTGEGWPLPAHCWQQCLAAGRCGGMSDSWRNACVSIVRGREGAKVRLCPEKLKSVSTLLHWQMFCEVDGLMPPWASPLHLAGRSSLTTLLYLLLILKPQPFADSFCINRCRVQFSTSNEA